MCYFPSSTAAPSTVESEIILGYQSRYLSLDLHLATHSNGAAILLLWVIFCGAIATVQCL